MKTYVKPMLTRLYATRIVKDAFDAHVETALRGLVCPEHGQPPKLVRHGDDIDVVGCCEGLVKLARKQLGGR